MRLKRLLYVTGKTTRYETGPSSGSEHFPLGNYGHAVEKLASFEKFLGQRGFQLEQGDKLPTVSLYLLSLKNGDVGNSYHRFVQEHGVPDKGAVKNHLVELTLGRKKAGYHASVSGTFFHQKRTSLKKFLAELEQTLVAEK